MMRVVKAGLLTTIQDSGRRGFQNFGVPVAGPMDQASHRLANLLVNNRRSAATLEITLLGPDLEFEQSCVFAVGGARFDLRLNNRQITQNTSYLARCGETLSFGRCLAGARAYLAVGGGFSVPPVFGSRATHVGSHMGGLKGRALLAGDLLSIGDLSAGQARAGESRLSPFAVQGNGARVRVVVGPHDGLFAFDSLDVLRTSRYMVTPDSDRMGYRLAGKPLGFRGRVNLISTALPVGSLQVTPSGQPIILMADHQTTGGYPRIATVISADLPMVGQLAPSAWIEFAICDPQSALTALIRQERMLLA
jgi:antagonist of KipI